MTPSVPPLHNTGLIHVNEALNLALGCIFIAVPKTGSTSIRSQLRQKGKPIFQGPHMSICQIRDLIYPALLLEARGKNRSFPTTVPQSDAELRQTAAEIFESTFKFSCVHNPWARAVSLFMRREGIQLAENISFEAFVTHHAFASDTCVYPTRHTSQSDWLCDADGTMLMDYVYKLENFDTAIRDIAEMTEGRVVLESRRANHNEQSKSDHYRDLYTDHTRKLIAKAFAEDIDRFEFTF